MRELETRAVSVRRQAVLKEINRRQGREERHAQLQERWRFDDPHVAPVMAVLIAAVPIPSPARPRLDDPRKWLAVQHLAPRTQSASGSKWEADPMDATLPAPERRDPQGLCPGNARRRFNPTGRRRPGHDVGQLKSNPFGLFDMHGNAFEWVEDWWDPAYYGQFAENSASNPCCSSPSGFQRVTRGGNDRNFPSHCRLSTRNEICEYKIIN